jgi:hypothetical protein
MTYCEDCEMCENNARGLLLAGAGTVKKTSAVKRCLISYNGSTGLTLGSTGFVNIVAMLNTILRNSVNGILISSGSCHDILFNTVVPRSSTLTLNAIRETSGPNSYMGNVVQSSISDALNYSLGGGSVITNSKTILTGGGQLPATPPTYWYNLSVVQ